jgi:hypothetical protein
VALPLASSLPNREYEKRMQKMKSIDEHFEKLIFSEICLYVKSGKTQPEAVFKEVCQGLNIKLLTVSEFTQKDCDLGLNFVAVILAQGKDIIKDLERISKLKELHKELPIIFYSTSYSEKVENLIRRQGVHFFLLPNFSTKELHLVLQALLFKKRNPSGQATFKLFR